MTFLRQIPYITSWKHKEISSLVPYIVEGHRKYEKKGTMIVQEGQKSDKVIIVLKGEVEIVKQNLASVFFNK